MKFERGSAEISMWLTEPLLEPVAKALQRVARAEGVERIAVMPDVHLAGEVCNGTVVATKDRLYPLAVGSDIGCGMLAVACDLSAEALSDEQAASRLLAGLYEWVPSNKHPRANLPEHLPGKLRDAELSSPYLEKMKPRDGLFQLGTLGRGNHFVEFQSDPEGRLWLMLHSGSRGMGQAITGHHLKSIETTVAGLGSFDAESPLGQAYQSDLEWAIEYAMQNRLAMARAVEDLIRLLFTASLDWSTLIHCHHNHVRREQYEGQTWWIHRKGALPASENEPGVIPGSMGSSSFHVTGRGCVESLNSSSHGAGRSLPRHVARSRISRQSLLQQMQGVWFDQRRSERLRDEAPSVYKEIGRVMRAQRELTRIVRELRPVLVYKGV